MLHNAGDAPNPATGLPHSRVIPSSRVTSSSGYSLNGVRYGLLLEELAPPWVSPSTGYPLSRLTAFMGLPPPRVILVDGLPPLRVTPFMVCLLYGLLLDGLPPPRVTPSTSYPLYILLPSRVYPLPELPS